MNNESVMRKMLCDMKKDRPVDPAPKSAEELFRSLAKAVSLEADAALLEDKTYLGDVFGPACAETGQYFLMGTAHNNPADFPKVGVIISEEEYRVLLADPAAKREGCALFGAWIDQAWKFHLFDDKRTAMTLMPYKLTKELFSRTAGLLDNAALTEKTAIIVGQGSVGSLVAMLLARLGVGRFLLLDRDTFGLVNISRHMLTCTDLGRYKVDAMRDLILRINPYAKVEVFRGWLQDVPAEMVSSVKNGIVVGTADHHGSNADANDLAELLGLPFVAIGCWKNAHAGAVFHWLPGRNMPTYGQANAQLIEEERRNPPRNYDYYNDPDEESTQERQNGLAANIFFVTAVGVLNILDLLHLDHGTYLSQMLHDHTNFTVAGITNRPEIGGETAAMFPHSLFITNTIVTCGAEQDE